MNCLVTGGAGFIGSHIVDALLKKKYHVRVLDNFFSGRRENLAHVGDQIEIIEGNIQDPVCVKKALKDIDIVFHQAALKLVPESFKCPDQYNNVNIQGTLLLLLEAKKNAVKKFVYASSSSVYGDSEKLPKSEMDPVNPISPYAISKLAAEYYCSVFSKSYQLPTVSLRYFNVFGPRQMVNDGYSNVIPKFIACILKGESPPVYGDGKQSRDFTYIENVVSANLLALEKEKVTGVYNVGMGERHDLLSIIAILNKILKKKIHPQFLAAQPGDVRHTLASIDHIGKHLDYHSKLTFQEGLEKTLHWFQELWG